MSLRDFNLSGFIPNPTLTLSANVQCCHITTKRCGRQVIPVYGQTARELNISLLLEKLETREVFYGYGTERITTARPSDSASSPYASQAIILQLCLRYSTISSMNRVSKVILHPIHTYILTYYKNHRIHST